MSHEDLSRFNSIKTPSGDFKVSEETSGCSWLGGVLWILTWLFRFLHTLKMHTQETRTPKTLRELAWNQLTVFWLNFEKNWRFLFCAVQALIIIKIDLAQQSQVDSVQKHNELAMHNMQCMNLCRTSCSGDQLPSNLYNWNAAQVTNPPSTQSQATNAIPAGVSCQDHLAALCERCWALRLGSTKTYFRLKNKSFTIGTGH